MTAADSWLFEEELWGFLCSCIYPKAVLVFPASSATTKLSSQRVKFETTRPSDINELVVKKIT
jgi:hypothetical protein